MNKSTTGGKSAKRPDPSGTGVGAWLSMAWGAGATVIIVLMLLPFQKTFLGDVFFSGGWVNYAEMFLFCWGMAILALKVRKTRRQSDALLLDVLPHNLGDEINHENVEIFLDHIYKLPARARESLMVARIQKGLEVFHGRGNNAEVASFISAQSDVDANRITGTYSLLKVFLWSIPILGFIGTVLGLSLAMQNFGSADLADMAQLKKSVSDITGGLATAFNTTLLGLILSMILMFPMSAMQKREDDMLTDIDAFCSGILLTRLNDGGSAGGGNHDAPPQEWMEQILLRQGEFLEALVGHSTAMKEMAQSLEERSRDHQQKVQDEFRKSVEKLTEVSAKAITENVKATGAYFNSLQEGLGGLNKVLKDLGEKQVIIQQKKKGWFGS
jgi:biopolymer transport protein ExbB/TolQ